MQQIITQAIQDLDVRYRLREALLALVLIGGVLTLAWLGNQVELEQGFPVSWNLELRQSIDRYEDWLITHRTTHPIFTYFFNPVSRTIDASLRVVERGLMALPWSVVVTAGLILGYLWGGKKLAALAAACLWFMAAIGLWPESMQTLTLIGVSVLISLLLGIPLGILSARFTWIEKILRPVLDAMQTIPAFVYLIPVLLVFGVARVPSVIATVIFALPPAIRLTNLGLRQVPHTIMEAAYSFGATSRQVLFKVQIPLAIPSIVTGINQTIMMALGMVVIAALIGAGGLGKEVLVSLQRLQVGRAMEAGLAIVFMAILLDRLGSALAGSFNLRRSLRQSRLAQNVVLKKVLGLLPPQPEKNQRVWRRLFEIRHWLIGLSILLLVFLLAWAIPALQTYPSAWMISIRAPVDAAVVWMRDNLYQIGSLPIGTGPFSDWLVIQFLHPLRALLTEGIPWPALILIFAAAGLAAAGWRLAYLAAFGFLMVGLLGMWANAMDTLSQVFVAVVIALVVGIPLGIASARSRWLEEVLRPVLDFFQTIPPFVYLVPVIMLFNIGRVPGIIAAVIYAIPPVIRLTNLGIRQVDGEVVEAADAFGSTDWQKLLKVQLPLALPSILLGVNQTIMMVLSMVVISGMVGGGGLGLEAVIGLAKGQTGRGIEAGLAIALIAMILDRITQGWAQKQKH